MIDRFLDKVDQSGGFEACWPWMASLTTGGYGQFFVYRDGPKRPEKAYRVAYELFVGEIPAGLEIHHLCENPSCVNPSHLEAVTRRVHSNRHADRRETCRRGHPRTPENIYWYRGWRCCRVCLRANARLTKRRKRERQAL